jgi:hypothetical protein
VSSGWHRLYEDVWIGPTGTITREDDGWYYYPDSAATPPIGPHETVEAAIAAAEGNA